MSGGVGENPNKKTEQGKKAGKQLCQKKPNEKITQKKGRIETSLILALPNYKVLKMVVFKY